jgi:toxin ParE1/3/4
MLAHAAKADLDGIYDYIAADSPDAAARFVTSLDTYLHKIARTGSTGVPRDWIRPGLRAHLFKGYAVYFRVSPATLTIVRIVHGSREIDALVFDAET